MGGEFLIDRRDRADSGPFSCAWRILDHSSKNIYDVWFPNLSPSEGLLKQYFPITEEKQWRAFQRRFLSEMKASAPTRDLDVLAALSHQTNFSIGCYCDEESRCHRSILRSLLEKREADLI